MLCRLVIKSTLTSDSFRTNLPKQPQTSTTMMNIADRIATELSVAARQVNAAIQLLDNGDTVPFISRYRKEVTGGLDDGQLRTLNERLEYLRELDVRRTSILKAIEEQDKLTPELTNLILK